MGSPLLFIYISQPGSSAWVVRCVVSGTVDALWVVMRAFRVLSVFLAFILRVFCRSMFGTDAVYAPWLAAAAACRVCEIVTVVDPLRFDLVAGVAVIASEKHAVSLVVNCVYLVAEGDHYGAWSTLSIALCDQYPGVVVQIYFY